MDRFLTTAPIAMQVLAKHDENTKNRQSSPRTSPAKRVSREEPFAGVSDAMMRGNNLLTRRVAEICTCIVPGCTIRGLGMNLGISINAVATLRKRTYAKLRISSQNELFAEYFALVESLG